jgi:hypothetical protein
MQVFVLFGCVAYEGDDLLGVYSTLELAQAARDSHDAHQERLADGGYYCDYEYFRIRALGVDSDAQAVPFFTSL